MTKAGKVLRTIGAEITILFGKHLPKNWQAITDETISALNIAKTIELSPGAQILASLFKGGNIALELLQKVTNEGLVTLEVAKGAEEAAAGIADPQLKADAIVGYIIAHVRDLPAEWQGKHWLDIAVKILEAELNISTTEANAIVNVRYGQLKGQ